MRLPPDRRRLVISTNGTNHTRRVNNFRCSGEARCPGNFFACTVLGLLLSDGTGNGHCSKNGNSPGTKRAFNLPTVMKHEKHCRLKWVKVAAFSLALCNFSAGQAATLWTGPDITFTKSDATPADVIIEGKVVLARGSNQVLLNTAAGETQPGDASPVDTEWGFGALADFATLQYQSMESLRNGNLAARIVGHPMVVHLIAEDIYFSINFTVWGQFGAGTVSYTRSTAPASTGVPPTVNLTSPTEGATFTAPASIPLSATADVTGGTVTNVSFFNQSTLLGSVGAAPFNLLATNLAAGSYSFTAVATAAGLSSTSSVVHVTVTGAATEVKLSVPTIATNFFSFSFNADVGSSYVIETSSTLTNWVPVMTNLASSNPVLFSQALATNVASFFRVGRLTNP